MAVGWNELENQLNKSETIYRKAIPRWGVVSCWGNHLRCKAWQAQRFDTMSLTEAGAIEIAKAMELREYMADAYCEVESVASLACDALDGTTCTPDVARIKDALRAAIKAIQKDIPCPV